MADFCRKVIRSVTDGGEAFCFQTSVHGFKHIAAPRRHWVERLLWAFVMVISVWGVINVSMGQWQRYNENPTVVTLAKDFRTWRIHMPAVTACEQKAVLQHAQLAACDASPLTITACILWTRAAPAASTVWMLYTGRIEKGTNSLSFGGAAGLFLGASFISFVEIGYFLLERAMRLPPTKHSTTLLVKKPNPPYEARIRELTAIIDEYF